MLSVFLLRDVRHAMHDIFPLRISAIQPEAISDGSHLSSGIQSTTHQTLTNQYNGKQKREQENLANGACELQ